MAVLLHVPALNEGGVERRVRIWREKERRVRIWRENERVLLQGKAGIVAMETMVSPQNHCPYLYSQSQPTSKPLGRESS